MQLRATFCRRLLASLLSRRARRALRLSAEWQTAYRSRLRDEGYWAGQDAPGRAVQGKWDGRNWDTSRLTD